MLKVKVKTVIGEITYFQDSEGNSIGTPSFSILNNRLCDRFDQRLMKGLVVEHEGKTHGTGSFDILNKQKKKKS